MVALLAGCADRDGTGEEIDAELLEESIAAELDAPHGGDSSEHPYAVDCPEGIEAGMDFECVAVPEGLEDDVETSVSGHLEEDGNTVSDLDTEPHYIGGG